ncbi:MAG TPA: UbiX family flavin prenyltransferase [Anaerovoracaceae bacterium]|nr:UbiX family flavin prenyltransferase [Anaerovoracaceae bacterium]
MKDKRRIIVAITGASGTTYGIRLLEALRRHEEIEIHLIVSPWAEENIKIETDYNMDRILELAHYHYRNEEMAARIASGSFRVSGMVVIPCSMKTLAAISCGFADNLTARAADVMLKERRTLIIVPRETPFNAIHLENMLRLARMGVSIAPPIPSFYHKPESIDDLISHFTGRVLDLLEIDHEMAGRWNGGQE